MIRTSNLYRVNKKASTTINSASRKKQTTIFPMKVAMKKLDIRKVTKTKEKLVETEEKKLDMAKEPSKEEERNSRDEEFLQATLTLEREVEEEEREKEAKRKET